MPPVLKERSTGTKEFLAEGGIESVQPRQKDDRVTPCTGDRDGVELEVPETPDDFGGRLPCTLPAASRPLRESGPLAFQQTGPGERQSACFPEAQRLRFDDVWPEVVAR